MQIVVCLPGGETTLWDLPVSRFDREEMSVSGGMRTLLELAFAIASLDRSVELRGSIPRTAFEELAEATGVQPRTGMDARSLSADDFVVIPCALGRSAFARYVLGPARVVLLLLGPPGLVGWPLIRDWTPHRLLTVSVDSVGRPEHFQAIAALGFELWTQSAGLALAAQAAGVPCEDIGSGNPVAYPPPEAKAYDLAYIEADKWAPLAREVVDGLGATVLAIPWLPRNEVLRQISRGRLFVLPSRIEGRARILIEARAMGTVPIALDTNPYATGLSEEEGVALASTTEQMRTLIPDLLADGARLEDLADRGRKAAGGFEDWEAYRTRLSAVLDLPAPADPGREARTELGRALRERHERDLSRSRRRLRRAYRELRNLRSRRSVRLALRASAMLRRVTETVRRPG